MYMSERERGRVKERGEITTVKARA